ncbi:MAG: hypothetical protein B5M51_08140, partial [Anaerolinea sp. 4484_236]
MIDSRIKKLADLLVNYSVRIQPKEWVPKEWVMIQGNFIAEPLISEVYRAVLEAGGNPIVQMGSNALNKNRYQYSSDEQLKWVSPVEKMLVNEIDAVVNL